MLQFKHLKILRTQTINYDQNENQTTQTNQSIELTKELIQSGFFKDLPGIMLPVYLFILTHLEADFTLNTSVEQMAEFLPSAPLEIELALTMLERQKFITLQDSDKGYKISLVISSGVQKTRFTSSPSTEVESAANTVASTSPEESMVKRNNELLDYIFKQKTFSEEDLVRAISSMLPAQNLNYGFRQEVDYWFKTFDKAVIKELVRRTDDAWQRDPDLNCQAYMRKIANEWIGEQVLTIADLETSDKVFRQVKNLLEEFGIERQKEMTRTHWQTVYKWINCDTEDDFALSLEVAKFAIQEAIRRKSDGRPSLNYIADNFIKPFKEAKVKTIEDAHRVISSGTQSKNSSPDKPDDKKNKWQLGIDFTRFREN